MKLKFRSHPALIKVIEGLILEEIPYKLDYLIDTTGTYEYTDFILEIDNAKFIIEGDETNE
jgi:hypothetical protein